jgi:hypothetical protein
MNAAERVSRLAKQFNANLNNRPKKRDTLESQIQAVFGKVLSPEEMQATVNELMRQKIITLSAKGEVAYKP